MVQAAEVKVEWNSEKKQWQIVIQAGAEVIRRPCANATHEASDAELKSMALATAKDEGYDLTESHVSIVR